MSACSRRAESQWFQGHAADTAIHDVEWLQKRHDWPGLQGVVMVESQREIDGRLTKETRFYITWPTRSDR
jgi:hypothetical protein